MNMLAVLALAAGLGPALAAPARAEDDEARYALGRTVFLERAAPACPICHTMAEPGAAGAVGPNLDMLKPSESRVRMAVTEGIGPMLPQEALSPEEIDALAYYVATATGAAD